MSPEEYQDEVDDFRGAEIGRGLAIARRSCCDGFCGASDCYTCRGEDALTEVEDEE